MSTLLLMFTTFNINLLIIPPSSCQTKILCTSHFIDVNGNVLKIQENLTTTSQDTFKFKIDKIVQINEACVGCIHPNYTNSW